MSLRDTDRAQTRLFAINLRLAELNREFERTAVHVRHLEARMEEARLAGILGQPGPDAEGIGRELEDSRGRLESQRSLIDSVKRCQSDARVRYALLRFRERFGAAPEGPGPAEAD